MRKSPCQSAGGLIVFGASGRLSNRQGDPLSVVKISDPTQLMRPVVWQGITHFDSVRGR